MTKLILDLDTGVDRQEAPGQPRVDIHHGTTATCAGAGCAQRAGHHRTAGHPAVKVYKGIPHSEATVVQVLKENGKTAQSKSPCGFTVPAWMGSARLYCTITSPDAAANIQRSF